MQLNYFGYFNSTGYSTSAQDYILAMMRVHPDVDIRTHYVNRRIGLGVSKNRNQIFTALNKKEASDPSVNLYHCIPPRYRRPPDKSKHFGFCVFETINPPKEWIPQMNNMDEIITASQFNKSIFENQGVTQPIHVVPHCFDEKMFNKDTKPPGRYSKFTFISIGAWKTRKNWEILIKAWYHAFELRNNVCLLIKTDKPDELKALVKHIKSTSEWRSKSTCPIYCEDEPVCDFEDIPKILRKGDIYISASLGEGFGLPGLHAMALGIPVVTTRFGGVLEYAKPDLCTYLEPHKYRNIPNMDNIPQLNNCVWPYLTISEISNKMRQVMHEVKDREEKAEKAYQYVHEKFTYQTIGNKLLETLELK
jgi:glycosyltransferase involved in cell wall biosynthesis